MCGGLCNIYLYGTHFSIHQTFEIPLVISANHLESLNNSLKFLIFHRDILMNSLEAIQVYLYISMTIYIIKLNLFSESLISWPLAK